MSFKSRVLLLSIACVAGLSGCGGGGKATSVGGPVVTDPGNNVSDPGNNVSPNQVPAIATACVAGSGHDYQVGSAAGQIPSLDQVPWESLTAGDTVRIFYSSQPYRGKFMLSGNGTADAPIRVCGVKGAGGERPIIDGAGAVSRMGLAYGNLLHETRSLLVIKPLSSDAWTAYPSHIQVDGIEFRGAVPSNTFTDSTGATQPYESFGACIWIERGHDITISDNVIHDCTNGVFSKSTDDGDFAVTRSIRLAGNWIYGNGVVGSYSEHGVYMESVDVVYEFNRFGPLRAGAGGNLIKDRSAGAVVRYNQLNGGAHVLDFVEAEDFPVTATSLPQYRTTFVYGNVIEHNGDDGSAVHYGGDHYGSTPGALWGEPIYRKGTLYFFSNTLSLTGYSPAVFQISTTEETAQVWNNVLYFAPGVTFATLRANSEVGSDWTAGGVLNLGKNWASSTVADSDPYHVVPGTVTGWDQLILGVDLPVDPSTFAPLPGSSILGVGQADLPGVATYPVQFQLTLPSFGVVARAVSGPGSDLGAIGR